MAAVIEIGQRVKVRRVRDRISPELVEKIKQAPTGTVKSYKMVDGSGIGVVVEFDSRFSTWFFEDEIEAA